VRGNKESHPNPNDAIKLDEFKELFMSSDKLHVSGKDWRLDIKGYQLLGLDSCIEDANNGIYTPQTITFAQKSLQRGLPHLYSTTTHTRTTGTLKMQKIFISMF
jgi:Icc protein